MRPPRYIAILFIVAASLISLSCSHEPEIKTAPQKPAPEAVSPPPPVKAEIKKEPDRTIIPPDEAKPAQQANVQEKPAEEGDTVSASLEDALNSYQEALQARERGDLDAAQAFLDQAFSTILKLHLPPDSPLLQEKNDLRLLIAQRIQEIYAIRRNPVNGNGKAIPLPDNKWVEAEIAQFTGPERKFFLEAYRRSGLYKDWIQGELRAAGLPEELVWLPIVESWFQTRALSTARALGMWQFIASTGYRYGLTRDKFIDERMDPYKATRAAVKYLDELHSFFGEWTTALASYNCGEARVQYCIKTQNVDYMDNFWDLFQRLPFQTARFVPRFIAAVKIIRDPARYGMELPEPYPPLKFETIKINHPAKLPALSAAFGLEPTELAFLNPELRQDSTPDREYELRVPVGAAEKALLALNTVPKYLPPEFATHIVRAGETLSAIARKYGTSVAALQRINNIKGTTIYVGRGLRIPVRGA